MLRVATQTKDDTFICRLEGRFTGEGAEHVRVLVTGCDTKLNLVIDLTELLFIDAVGEDVLLFAKKLAGKFIAENSYSRDICERLDLPLANNDNQNLQVSGNGKKNGRQRPANGDRRRVVMKREPGVGSA
jgi:hypothetical protein